MSKWNLPPKEGHLDKADGIYLQNMNIAEIRERVKKNDVIIMLNSIERFRKFFLPGHDSLCQINLNS